MLSRGGHCDRRRFPLLWCRLEYIHNQPVGHQDCLGHSSLQVDRGWYSVWYWGVESESNPVHIVVAECVNDRVIPSFCILWVTVNSLHCWYARGNTQLFTITLMQNLVLVRNIYNR